jgi:hypothetical protein
MVLGDSTLESLTPSVNAPYVVENNVFIFSKFFHPDHQKDEGKNDEKCFWGGGEGGGGIWAQVITLLGICFWKLPYLKK